MFLLKQTLRQVSGFKEFIGGGVFFHKAPRGSREIRWEGRKSIKCINKQSSCEIFERLWRTHLGIIPMMPRRLGFLIYQTCPLLFEVTLLGEENYSFEFLSETPIIKTILTKEKQTEVINTYTSYTHGKYPRQTSDSKKWLRVQT